MAHDDDTLMRMTASGDEMAFRDLVARWQQPVYAFLVHMLDSEEDARDLAQDTFLTVWGKASRYRPEGRFRSWLLRIAGNKARSMLRRRKVLRWVGLGRAAHDQPAPGDDPARALERRDTAARVRAAVAALPPRQREAVVLRRFQGLSYREIAATMGTTRPAVESLLQRAAASLQTMLAGEYDPAGRRDVS